MSDYKNGKIYMIESKIGNVRYYGSTVQTLKQRLTKHKTDKKRYEEGKKTSYKTSYQILDYDDYEISLVQVFSCRSKKELETRERWYIENNECVNKFIPTRTKKEYYEEHKEEINERNKKWYDEHRQKVKEYNKEYHQRNKQERSQQKKKYREEHKERILQQKKDYYEKNKEQISEKKTEKLTCPCGAEVSRTNSRRHERSIKHQEWLEIFNFIYS